MASQLYATKCVRVRLFYISFVYFLYLETDDFNNRHACIIPVFEGFVLRERSLLAYSFHDAKYITTW